MKCQQNLDIAFWLLGEYCMVSHKRDAYIELWKRVAMRAPTVKNYGDLRFVVLRQGQDWERIRAEVLAHLRDTGDHETLAAIAEYEDRLSE